MRIVVTAVLAVFALTACTSAGSFTSGRTSSQKRSGNEDFASIAGGRDLRTVVRGNPFDTPDEAFAAQVTGILERRNTDVDANFTTQPGASARDQYRLVLVFNQARVTPGVTVCRDLDSIPLGPPSDPLKLQIAFCNGDNDITSIKGRVSGVTGPEDERFADFLGNALFLVKPRRGVRRFDSDD